MRPRVLVHAWGGVFIFPPVFCAACSVFPRFRAFLLCFETNLQLVWIKIIHGYGGMSMKLSNATTQYAIRGVDVTMLPYRTLLQTTYT